MVEGQTEFILRLDPDGILTFVNDAYCRYRGLDRDAMLGGFNDVDHYPPEQQARIRAAWAGLTPEFAVGHLRAGRSLAPTAAQRWEEWTDTAVFAPDGRVVEYQAIGRDITERKLRRAVAARQRGALSGAGRDPVRVHHPAAPGRAADLRQRGVLPVHRAHSRGDAGAGLERLRPDRARGSRAARRASSPR